MGDDKEQLAVEKGRCDFTKAQENSLTGQVAKVKELLRAFRSKEKTNLGEVKTLYAQ